MIISKAEKSDLYKILELQHLSYQSEAAIYNDHSIQPLRQTLQELEQEYMNQAILKAIIDGSTIGSVRAQKVKDTCMVGKLIVHPRHQNQGIGSKLMIEIERLFADSPRFELFTGNKSERNLYLYSKLGYKIFKSEEVNLDLKMIYMEKIR